MAESWGLKRVQNAATAAQVKPEVAAPLIKSCAFDPAQKDLAAELLPLALEEWGIDPAVSPTGCLCVIFGTWAFGIQQACATLAALAPRAVAAGEVVAPAPATEGKA